MAAEGFTYGNRVNHFNYEKELATVVDAILNSTTIASHLLFRAKNFDRHTLLKTVKIARRTQFQEVAGLEALNSSPEDVTIQMQFNRGLAQMPKTQLFTEMFGRQYDSSIDFDAFEMEDVVDETLQGLNALLLTGGTSIVGLDAITDDGGTYGTIGGASRSTYPTLGGQDESFATGGSLSALASLVSSVSDTGPKESPTNIFTTFEGFDLIESLYLPTVRHEYKTMPVGGMFPMAQKADGMGMGFSTLDYRGIPIARDKSIAAGKGYVLNLNYLDWYGDAKSPTEFLRPVNLGKATKEGQVSMKPSDFNGFFYQSRLPLPTQGGTIERLWVSGQLVSFQPRRQGRWESWTSNI